jgi:subtilisin family serine protease
MLLVAVTQLLSAKDYHILSEGTEQVLRLQGDGAVVEVGADGKAGELLLMETRVVLRASRAAEVPALARRVGALEWRQAAIGGFYNLEFDTAQKTLEAAESLQALGHEASPAIRRQKHSRFTPRDPLFADQWHLKNTGQRGGTKGIDLNLSEVWKSWRGKGVSIAVVDDGLEIRHPDLSPNCFSLASKMHFDFNAGDTDPSPARGNDHGTAVAGVLASPSNSIGGLGVAP